MAEHGAPHPTAGDFSEEDYAHGDMVIDEHVRTYKLFMTLTKWGSLYIGALVLLLTLWFCTPAGFIGGAFTVAIMIAVGIQVLGDKRKL